MKRVFLMSIAWLGMQTAFAQTVTKNVGDFTSVKVFDKINVQLVASSKSQVQISGEKANDVQVINKDGDLKIRMQTTKTLQGSVVNVTVYYNKGLQEIDANEGATVTNSGKIKSNSLALNVQEGASINVSLDVQKLSVNSVTGGVVQTSGKATTQGVVINTGGKYNGKDLTTSQTTVAINAGGSAEVYASKVVDAKTRAGGTIDIYGSPATVNKKTNLGGQITVH